MGMRPGVRTLLTRGHTRRCSERFGVGCGGRFLGENGAMIGQTSASVAGPPLRLPWAPPPSARPPRILCARFRTRSPHVLRQRTPPSRRRRSGGGTRPTLLASPFVPPSPLPWPRPLRVALHCFPRTGGRASDGQSGGPTGGPAPLRAVGRSDRRAGRSDGRAVEWDRRSDGGPLGGAVGGAVGQARRTCGREVRRAVRRVVTAGQPDGRSGGRTSCRSGGPTVGPMGGRAVGRALGRAQHGGPAAVRRSGGRAV